METIKLIVFLPLLAAIVAGLGNRMLGNFAAKLVTTGALFISCALSWPIFVSFLAGSAEALSCLAHHVPPGAVQCHGAGCSMGVRTSIRTAMTDTSRLDALEIRIAHQDEVIEDLNRTVTAQWKEIDRLTREITMLSDRLASAEQAIGPDPGEEPPPPHW